MIKLSVREMKSLSRILTVCLCCVPAFATAAPVATTAGSNLTAYHPNNNYNNQWATISNARYDENAASARVNFGNCNAVVLRCAQPKCANGGCVDESVASAIVSGCVKSNDKCKQYGDDLVKYMTAQLVANSNAKINEQQAAIAQAKAQAEAQAAAAQNEQISQMQNQMYQMQQQMAQQQQESAAQLQEALAQQAAQSAAAIENMKAAATDAAKQTEAGISAYQQDAIDRGISQDVLARQQVTGQIITEIEDAETALTAMRKAMQNSFDYAGCDARGNNCTGPKRVKKWRELAGGFIEPYDNAIDKIYDALDTARIVGVDLSQIYAMLEDSCSSWSQYVCPGYKAKDDGTSDYMVYYGYYKKDSEGKDVFIQDAPRVCQKTNVKMTEESWKACQRCIWTKTLHETDDIYIGWVDIDQEAKDNQIVVACSSSAVDNSKLFKRRTRNKNGAGLVDIDLLEKWIEQEEPTRKPSDTVSFPKLTDYCKVKDGNKHLLEQKVLSRVVKTEKNKANEEFCVKIDGSNWKETDSEDCPYIGPLYAICNAHPYNAGITEITASDVSENQQKIKDILGLKTTVVSQQMYKQYEYLRATLRRLKIQLEKAVLTANLEAAGAKSESGSSYSSINSEDKTIHLAGAENCSNKTSSDSAYTCLQTNISLIISSAAGNTKKACQQLNSTIASAKLWQIDIDTEKNKQEGSQTVENKSKCVNIDKNCNKNNVVLCAQELNAKVIQKKEEREEKQRNSGYRDYR